MSQRTEKQKRRKARQQEERRKMLQALYAQTLFNLPASQTHKQDVSFAFPPLHKIVPHQSTHPLKIAIEPAVTLYILELYERGGPRAGEIEEVRAFGEVLASQGDMLLYRSGKRGETAQLYERLAKALAVLAHMQEGGVFVFGNTFDVVEILSGFVGREAADAYWRAWRDHSYAEL